MTEPAENRRRSIRMQMYDYSCEGAYFITICTQNREYLFGEIVDGVMHPNAPGEMILQTWEELPARFPFLQLDTLVLMPNHLHAIEVIRRGEPCVRPVEGNIKSHEFCILPSAHPQITHIDQGGRLNRGEHKVRPYGKRPRGTVPGSIGRIIQAFKSITTRQYIQGIREHGWQSFKGRLWQRNYYERVIRDEEEWERIWEYIAANPINWAMDRENREAGKIRAEEPWQV
jgi:REP element-mobilizing transposase RayT